MKEERVRYAVKQFKDKKLTNVLLLEFTSQMSLGEMRRSGRDQAR